MTTASIQTTDAKHPYDVLFDAIAGFTARRNGDHSRTVVRVRQNGRIVGHCRARSIVDEGDRMKFYGLSFFLDIRDFGAARARTSRSGETVAVEIDTPYGQMTFDSPPGLRLPSRRRASRLARRV